MTPVLQTALAFAAALAAGAVLGSLGGNSTAVPAPLLTNKTTPSPEPPPASPVNALAAILDSDLPGHYDTAAIGKERDLIARFWSRADPGTFLDHLLATDPPFFSDPSHALYLFDTWAARDFDAALQASLDLPAFNPLRLHIQHRVVAKKFASDPATAIAALGQIWANNGSSNSNIIPFTADPQTSLTHLTALPRTDVALSAIDQCLEAWATTDPAAALTWAQENAVSTTDIVAVAWKTDPHLAIDLLSRLTSPQARSRAARNIAVNLLKDTDPDLSVTIIDTHLESWTQRDAAHTLAKKLARKDPRSTAELALTFHSPAARHAALTTALEAFHTSAPQSLDHWVASLPDGPQKNATLAALQEITRPPAPPAATTAPPGD